MGDSVTPEGYNTSVPAKILTPDRVDTRIGTLEFTDGFPTETTAQLLFDHLDFLRAVEVFLSGVPAASLEAMRIGMEEVGVTACHQVGILDRLLDSTSLFLTGNTDTVYVSGILDLERDGPTVVEVPPGCGPTTVNDAWFRFITDMGRPGPDRGAGGKYLILPAGYDGPVPDGYFVSRSPSRMNWLIMRGLLVDGKPDAPTRNFREGLRVYPLSQADAPPAMEFISLSEREFNTIHANDVTFFQELNAVVQREPLDVIDPETRGLLASIGITKGTPFAPDDRMQALLDRGRCGRERHRPGHRLQDPRPRGVSVPEQSVEDRIRRKRLPVAPRQRGGRTQPRCPDDVLLHRDGQHPGHGTTHARRRIPVRAHRARQPRRVPRRSQALSAHAPGRCPRQRLLVCCRLRPPDTIRAPNRPAISRAATAPATPWPRTRTARSLSRSARPHPRTTLATGSRPPSARTGSPCCGSTGRWSLGSRRHGCPATSNPLHADWPSASRDESAGEDRSAASASERGHGPQRRRAQRAVLIDKRQIRQSAHRGRHRGCPPSGDVRQSSAR